jgi:streptogramin lyase
MRACLVVAAVVGVSLTAACSDGGTSGSAEAERATSSYTGSGAILPPPEDPPWTPAPGQPTEVPAKPKIPLPRLEKLPSTSLVVHGAPAALLASPGALWVQQHRGYELTRVDPETGKVVDSVNVGQMGCGDLNWASGDVWQTGCAVTRGLVQVGGDTSEVLNTVHLSGLGSAYLDGEIWMTTLVDGVAELRRIDVAHVDEGSAVPVPGLSADGSVEVVAGSVWVSDTSAMVYQLDPISEEVVAVIPMPVPPDAGELIEHDGAAWYVDQSLGVLVRVDPVDGSTRLLKVRAEMPREYRGLAASTAPGTPGRLWMRSGDKEVWLVDTRHDKVLRRIAVLDGGGGDVQQIGDTLWVSSFATNEVQRIPLTR